MGGESVVAAIEAVKRGEMVVVTDDASRENEGDIIMAAELATTETLAFTVRYTGGVICVAMPDERMKELELPPMLAENQDPKSRPLLPSRSTATSTLPREFPPRTARRRCACWRTRKSRSRDSSPGVSVVRVFLRRRIIPWSLYLTRFLFFLRPRPGHIFSSARPGRWGACARRPHGGVC